MDSTQGRHCSKTVARRLSLPDARRLVSLQSAGFRSGRRTYMHNTWYIRGTGCGTNQSNPRRWGGATERGEPGARRWRREFIGHAEEAASAPATAVTQATVLPGSERLRPRAYTSLLLPFIPSFPLVSWHRPMIHLLKKLLNAPYPVAPWPRTRIPAAAQHAACRTSVIIGHASGCGGGGWDADALPPGPLNPLGALQLRHIRIRLSTGAGRQGGRMGHCRHPPRSR